MKIPGETLKERWARQELYYRDGGLLGDLYPDGVWHKPEVQKVEVLTDKVTLDEFLQLKHQVIHQQNKIKELQTAKKKEKLPDWAKTETIVRK